MHGSLLPCANRSPEFTGRRHAPSAGGAGTKCWRASDAGLGPHTNQRVAAIVTSGDGMPPQLPASDNEAYRG